MNSTNEDPPVRTTVTIPKPDYDEIERIARDMRVSVAWVVREAVTDYIASGAGTKLAGRTQADLK